MSYKHYLIRLNKHAGHSVESLEHILRENVNTLCNFFGIPENEYEIYSVRCYDPYSLKDRSRDVNEIGIAISGHIFDNRTLLLYWPGDTPDTANPSESLLRYAWFPFRFKKKKVFVASIGRKHNQARIALTKDCLLKTSDFYTKRKVENVRKKFRNCELISKDIYVMRDKILTPENCRFLIDIYERFGKSQARQDSCCSLFTARVTDFEKDKGCTGADGIIYEAVRKIMLAIHFFLDMDLTSDDGYQITKMSHYLWGSYPCSPNRKSRVNVIIQLNDVRGGEIFFPRQDAVVRLQEGAVVVFPNSWTHPFYHLFVEDKETKYVCETSLS